MRTKLAISVALIAVTLLSSTISFAQQRTDSTPNLGDWSRINSVPTGDKLSIKLKNGQTVEGKLSAFSDDELSLTLKGKPTVVKREEVSSVYHVTRKSAATATLIGMGAGAGAGAAIGLAGSGSGFDKLDQAVTAGLTIIGGGAGAAVGYLIGRKSRKRVLLYQAP